MGRRRLLVVGSGSRVFREYALAAISARAELLLVVDGEVSWEGKYAMEVIRLHDIRDHEALQGAALRLRPDGILTYDERLVESVAQIARELCLSGPDPEAVHICKDKSALRELLTREGIDHVKHAVVQTPEDALRRALRIGWPVVVKPLALGGSVGVRRADGPEDLLVAFNGANGADYRGHSSVYKGVLIEEYLEGPEISVDGWVWNRSFSPQTVAEKRVAFAPFFEETGHLVPANPSKAVTDAIHLVARAHEAVGLDCLLTHTEVRLTADGPRLIEINARLGGDLIPYLGQVAEGIDLPGAAAAIALGDQPQPAARGGVGFAAVALIYPTNDLLFKRAFLENGRDHYAGLDKFEVVAQPDSALRLPPRGFLSRVALAVVSARTREECAARARAVEEGVIVEGTPLDVPGEEGSRTHLEIHL